MPNNPCAKSPSAEADKFQIFERWLRTNGAQFPLLELRKYDSPKNNDDDAEDDDDNFDPLETDNEAEEKKDGGNPSGVRSESEGVAMMSLDGNNNNQPERKFPEAAAGSASADDDGSKEMRGVHAKGAIPPQTVIVSIPKSCLITVEMGQGTPIGRKILQSDLELDAPKHIFLMIYLLWDRKLHGPRSFFAPYYDILPRSLRNMPVFWTEEELAGLEGSHLLVQIADRAEAIREDYESIRAVAPELAHVATLEEFQWARMIVCSRNFGLLVNGHRTSALVPHADMLNHYRPRETKWTFCEETQCFTITSLQGIGRGSQVYDSYGQKCNHRFLLNYGFCVEKNVEIDGFCPNEVPLELGLDLASECSAGGFGESGANGNGNGGGSRRGIANNDRECWEKKLAFWSRGDGAMGVGSHHMFGDATGLAGTLGASAGGGAMGMGSSFHALAAAVAGASTRGASTSTDIAHNMASMSDASTATALAEAMAGGTMTSSPAARSTGSSPPPSRPITICPVKRVRVCVSNNENTRILFSMLRVLACNSAELDRITSGGRLGIGGGMSISPFHSGGGPGSAAQRLFGVSAAAGMTSASSGTSLRTCRDVRHPINLRNERRAAGILLEVTARALSNYPTSLAQDAADLRDEAAYPKYSNGRNAKLQVRGEKEVLHHFALWARTAVHVIDIILRELEAERKLLAGSEGRVVGAGAAKSSHDESGALHGANQSDELSYDCVVQAMEDDDDCHTTILRYCSDVLGAVRRDELNRIASSALGSSA